VVVILGQPDFKLRNFKLPTFISLNSAVHFANFQDKRDEVQFYYSRYLPAGATGSEHCCLRRMQADGASKCSRLVASECQLLVKHIADQEGIGIDLTLDYGYRAFLIP
jgi:hypothetical protein